MSTILSIVVVLIGLYPFYDLAAMRGAIEQQGSLLSMSPVAALVESVRGHMPIELGILWLKLISGGIVLGALGWHVLAVWQTPYTRCS